MPIISPTAISPHRIGGKSWQTYWTPLIIDYTDTQFVFKFKLPADKSITIAWGDGTTEDVSGNGDTIVEATSNYSAPGSYEFKLTGDWLKITYIDISNQSFVSGDVSNWANLTTVRQPLMAFVFDDGYKMDLSVAYPLFSSKGHVACSAIITDNIGSLPNFMDSSEILQLQSNGWEIMSHSVSHPDFTTLNEAQLEAELANSKSILEGLGCVVNSIVYPLGKYNDTVAAATLEHYRAGLRSVSYFPTTRGFVLFPIEYGKVERASTDMDTVSIDTLKTIVDEAVDVWRNAGVIFYFHAYYLDAEAIEYFTELLDYINSKGHKLIKFNSILDIWDTYKECDIYASGTAVGFSTIRPWHSTSKVIDFSDCNLTATEVDNALIGMSHYCHLCTIKIDGNNASRTSASDEAVITLIQNQNTIECGDVLNFNMISDGTIRNVSIKFKIDAGKDVYLNWGDGSASVKITADGSDQTVTSNYPTANRSYYIALYGEVEFIRTFELTNLFFTVDVAQFYQCSTLNRLSLTNIRSATGSVTALTSLTLLKVTGSGARVSGSVAGLINLTSLHVEGANTLTGSINLLTSCTFMLVTGANTLSGNVENLPTSATYIWVSSPGCLVKYGGGATKAWQNTYMTIHGQWTTVMLDAFLNAWAATATGTANRTIDLAGTNDPRSSASDAAVVSLEAKFKVFTFTA